MGRHGVYVQLLLLAPATPTSKLPRAFSFNYERLAYGLWAQNSEVKVWGLLFEKRPHSSSKQPIV